MSRIKEKKETASVAKREGLMAEKLKLFSLSPGLLIQNLTENPQWTNKWKEAD